MGMQYRHTLIPLDQQFVPAAARVRAFLSRITELGVVPAQPAMELRVSSGRTREYPNPLTGGTVVVQLKDRTRLETLDQLEIAAASLSDFEAQVSGEGRPRLPPIEIDFAEPYYLGVTCFVSSTLRCTSMASYGKQCDGHSAIGIFQHPETLETIEVPGAGAARFWIEFEFGKFVFPKFSDRNLELLDLEIVEAAEDAFGGQFVQGCCWG
jgi:hypothetical protein